MTENVQDGSHQQTTQEKSFRILPLGVGSAFTSRFYHTCFLFLFDKKKLLVDCPAPFCRILKEGTEKAGLSISPVDIDALFITHLHGDHTSGVEELGFYRRFITNHSKPALYLFDSLIPILWDQKLKSSMGYLPPKDESSPPHLESYFTVNGVQPGDENSTHILGAEFTFIETDHLLPCLGFKVSYQGKAVGFSSDTDFMPSFEEFFKDCDLVIHEVGQGHGHTTVEQLSQFSKELQGKIHLTHIDDQFDILKSPYPVLEEGKLLFV